MRLNRSTLALVIISVAVIIGVALLNNSPLTAPPEQPTATPNPEVIRGPAFPDLTADQLVQLSVTNNNSGDTVVLTRADDAWTITEASFAQELATDSEKALAGVEGFVTLESVEQFTVENEAALAPFGLDTPDFTITTVDEAGNTYTLAVGDRSRVSQRFYGLLGDDRLTVHQFAVTRIDSLTGLIAQPPYVPSPTPTATATRTPNPISEVQQTATAEAALQALTPTAVTPVPTAEE